MPALSGCCILPASDFTAYSARACLLAVSVDRQVWALLCCRHLDQGGTSFVISTTSIYPAPEATAGTTLSFASNLLRSHSSVLIL
jgi:hypothetical protein